VPNRVATISFELFIVVFTADAKRAISSAFWKLFGCLSKTVSYKSNLNPSPKYLILSVTKMLILRNLLVRSFK